jgi:hypothetical protein
MSHETEHSDASGEEVVRDLGNWFERYALIALGLAESLATTVAEMAKVQHADFPPQHAQVLRALVGKLTNIESHIHALLERPVH